jgi:hypothetical protein
MEGMGEKTGKILVPATFGKAPARERFKLGSNLPDFRSRDPCTEPAANWTTSLSLFTKR